MGNDARSTIVPFVTLVKRIGWNVSFIRKDFVSMVPFVDTNMYDENALICPPWPILPWDCPKCKPRRGRAEVQEEGPRKSHDDRHPNPMNFLKFPCVNISCKENVRLEMVVILLMENMVSIITTRVLNGSWMIDGILLYTYPE